DIASVIALASAISGQTLATFDYTVPDRRGRGRSSPRSATAAPRGRQTVAPAETGRPTESRRVEPVQLVVLGAHWYLFAWDLVRRDGRVFRLDRMSDVHATTLESSPRPHPDAEAAVSSAVTTAAYSHTVIIGMRSTVAEAGQWFSSRAATITEAADGVRIAFGIDDLATAATHLAMIPVPVEMIDPPELIDQMAALAQRAQSTAATSGKGRRLGCLRDETRMNVSGTCQYTGSHDDSHWLPTRSRGSGCSACGARGGQTAVEQRRRDQLT